MNIQFVTELLDRLINTGVYLVCVQHIGDQAVQGGRENICKD